MSELSRSPLSWFFGVVVRPRSWLNLLYLALAFPLGLFYFVFLTVFLSVGISLAIIWVGIFILGVTAACWWAFAAFERSLADGLLGTDLTPAPEPWRHADGTWPRIKAHFGSSATWKDLAFLFVKFPLGLLSFCVVVVLGATSLALATAPFYYRFAYSTDAHGVSHHGLDFGIWHVDRLGPALLLVPVGLLLGVVSLHVFNGLAAMWRAVARGLLPADTRPRPVTPVASQTYQAAPPLAPPLASPPDVPGQAPSSAAGSQPQPGTPWPQWPAYPGYPGYPGYPPYPSPPYPTQSPYPQQPYPQQPYPQQPYPQQPYGPQAGQPSEAQAGAPTPSAQWPGAPWPQWPPLFGPPQVAGGPPAAAPVAPSVPEPPAEPPAQPPASGPAGPGEAMPHEDQTAPQEDQTAPQEDQP